MADYNTFSVIDCKSQKCLLITSSARKATRMLEKGIRIDVWNNNELVVSVYDKTKEEMRPYIKLEKEYIARKQKKAELRNKMLKKRHNEKRA